MKKTILWIAIVLVVLVVGGAIILFTQLNSIVRSTVQTQATKSLALETKLDSANVSLLGQTVSLSGMSIASPEGFSAPSMFSLDDITVKVAYSELAGDPVRVADISIVKPTLVLEQQGGKFNLQSLMNLKSDEPTSPDAETLKLIIGHLKVTGANVVVRPNIPGLPEKYDLTIPDIDLSQIGTADGSENGAAIKEVVMQLTTVMAQKAANSELLPPEVRAVLSGNVEGLAKEVVTQYAGKLAKDLTKDLPAGAAEALQGVLKDPKKGLDGAIGNLLNNNKTNEAGATTQPAKEDVGKQIEQGLGDLLKKKDKE